jgi:hypothetical protein
MLADPNAKCDSPIPTHTTPNTLNQIWVTRFIPNLY